MLLSGFFFVGINYSPPDQGREVIKWVENVGFVNAVSPLTRIIDTGTPLCSSRKKGYDI